MGDPSLKAGQEEKSSAEIKTEAEMLNRMGKALAAEGYQFCVHNHAAEMRNNAREWGNTLNNTEPHRP